MLYSVFEIAVVAGFHVEVSDSNRVNRYQDNRSLLSASYLKVVCDFSTRFVYSLAVPFPSESQVSSKTRVLLSYMLYWQ